MIKVFTSLFILALLTFPLVTQAQTSIASYDFNSGNQGWTRSSNNEWIRDNNSFAGASGNHWRITPYNDYNNNMNSSVTSPAIDLSGYARLNFSIDVRYKTALNRECTAELWGVCFAYDDFYDGMNIEYSTNGTTWQRLGNTGEGTNWYNHGNVSALGNNVHGWAEDNGSWQTAGITLPVELIGQTSVRFRINFASNNTGREDGVAFDNVVITGTYPLSFAPTDGSAPGGVSSNLSLWLKADQEVKEVGSDAYAWGDRSGNNNHAFQLVENEQPQYLPYVLNGNPVVYFEEGPYMDGAAGFHTQQYFIVVDPNEIYNNTNAVGRIIGFEDNDFGHLAFGPSTSLVDNEIITHAVGGANGYRAAKTDTEFNYGNPSLISSGNIFSGGTAVGQYVQNNGSQANNHEANINNFYNINNEKYRLGDLFYDLEGRDLPLNGRIAEVISYSTTLSASQRRDVETYLAIKYGITLDISTQNYTVYGYSIYDNKSYANDIAGIGKHLVNQGLNQRASKSENQGAIITISNPSSLDDGDYLVWGNDGTAVSWIQASVPAGNADRFARTWYVQETGEVGTVDLSINMNQLGIDIDNSTVNLFQAPAGSSVPNTFSTATAHTNGVRSTNSEGQIIVTFQNIDFSNGEYFTIGGDIQTTSPGGVKDDLSMWFKADGGVSVSGSSVMRWSDYSGNANDVYQGNNSLRPTYISHEINFNPAIDFDNDYLDGIDGFYTQDYFIVAKPDAIVNRSNNQGALVGFESGANSSLMLGSSNTNNYNNEIITHLLNSGYQTVINHNTRSFNPPLIINSKNNAAGNRQEIFVDGFLESTATANNGSFTNLSDTELRIGSAFNGSAYSGQIAEVISYSSRLSDTQRRNVQTYLAIKYGITLNISAQSYTARGNNIYNYTTHASNIAGIGRDLDNGYNQTRSRSSNTGAIIEMGNASSLNNGDYLVWGKDAGLTTTVQTTEKPTQYDERIAAEYRVAVTGTPGTVRVKVYVGGLPNYSSRSKTANFYSLLINNSGNFATVNSAIAASSFSGDTLVFNNVSFANGDYFTLAVPAAPSIGAGNTLWLRADKGLTLSGTTVTGWADQSGSNNHASPPATGPSLVNNHINGNPALTFNGNTIQGTAGFYTREYFIVADPDITYSSSSSAGFMVGYETGQVSGLALGNSVGTWGDEVLTHIRTNRHIAYRGSATYSAPTIFNSRNNNGSTPQSLFTNGTNLAVSTTGTVSNLNNQAYRLGNNFNNSGAFNGKISEVMSFSATLSAAEKRNIETYLALKYGITLGSGNYTLGGSTIFNATTFSGFTYDVVGIASYAKYDFLQTTSRSVNSGAVLTISNPGSLNNNDFLVIGNNAGAMTSTTTGVPAQVGERVVRKWAVQMTNTPGTVTLSFDLNGLGYASKNISAFSLILDTDSDFGNGVSRLVTPASWTGQLVTFTNVNLNGINYLGLGTDIDLAVDTDTDGIPDYFEIAYGTDPNNGNAPVTGGSPYTDTDSNTGINGDGISDALEKILADNGATGPITRYTDTDGDGIPDWIEVKNGSSPFDAHSPTSNGSNDSDGDGLPNALEILITQSGGAANASIPTDTDGDGVPDFLEIINHTVPNSINEPVVSGGADLDGDGVTDAMEATIVAGGATLPVDKESDTDIDGIPDYIEAITFSDPFSLASPAVPNSISIRINLADWTVTGGSCTNLSGHQWINILDPLGRLVFSINPVGNDLGSTCYGVRILSGIGSIRTNGERYVLNRNWYINPTTQPTGEKVYIRFYVRGQEMLDLWTKAVDLGIITSDVNEALFNQDHVRITKIGGMDVLEPFVSGGSRTLLAPKLISFGASEKILTIGTNSFSSFVVHTGEDNTTLPVSFLYFQGQALDNTVELNWATSSETNNDYFEIERSGNELDFKPIAQVKGAGNSINNLEYIWVDDRPQSGASYYRLKQVDFDGQYSYSKIITVTMSAVEEAVVLYPNPTKGQVYLYLEKDPGDVLPDISVLDLRGRKLQVNVKQESKNKFVFDINHLSSGTYLVEILYLENRIIKHIIKK
ncbi:T9SS type A sorting domain-containing protein [Catalinimonas niigatensis]|uniref:T9SS type A sorting domain-containing protein n=1 Tax=Catalinimonas niigatensis TaxID=1397264 RepID=UPI0026659148|nr:T9SS type A sorting domain-containing protein [Catalinimonas niigatensis]WPP50100.1 T9SS type A sorting domain-containing protein [Catalinimonas niigatensis]